jgi:hypothetical protein
MVQPVSESLNWLSYLGSGQQRSREISGEATVQSSALERFSFVANGLFCDEAWRDANETSPR